MSIAIRHYTVHEAEVAFFAAWRDGMPVSGPLQRHGSLGMIDEFRAGLSIRQVREDGQGGGFGEWRMHGGDADAGAEGWMVDFSLPLAAVTDGGAQVSSWPEAGAPIVAVVRFLDKELGLWRVFQFHDAVLLPSEAGEEGQNMMRKVSLSAGWMEERYSGTVPDLVPVVRPVIEWRHAGKRVRAWEYDPDGDAFTECAENVETVGEDEVRYVTLALSGEGDEETANLAYLAAATTAATRGGLPGYSVGWASVGVFEVGSSGLTAWPGWEVEDGAAEPITMPPSGRHWEHPRVVVRLLGRIYATVAHGVIAVPLLTEGFPPGMIDPPLRMGRLVFLPDGAWLLPADWREVLP
jgi:hypothetical protein